MAAVPTPRPPAVQERLHPVPDGSATHAAHREIPADHVVRIRTWLRYGMTIAEVAAVYGVQIGEIERVLRQT